MKKIFTLLALLFAFQSVHAQSDKPEKVVMKPALLVIDVQKQFLPMMSKEDQERALEMMDAANYDYEAFLIRDAIISHDAQYTKQVESIFNALDMNTIDYMFKIRKE